MNTIRLSITPKLNTALKELKEKKFSFLENAEIIKTIFAEYYAAFKEKEKAMGLKKIKEWSDSLPIRQATKEEEKAIGQGLKDIEKENYITVNTNDEQALNEYLGIR